MTETEILDRLKKRIAPSSANLIAGIGDDCAIYRTAGSQEDLLFTTDFLIEDIHFLAATHSPADIGHKALARGLSDIAAMGGSPKFCLLSLALPQGTDSRWIDKFYGGFLKLANLNDVALAGGDLSRSSKIVCDVVCSGGVPRGKALLRSGAEPGDAIYVSGRLGGSALGLSAMKGAAKKRHLRPEPRLALGGFLREILRATAAMDLSDGLSMDLRRMCEASKLSAEIEDPPRFPGASLEMALHGGEDYELLFTASPGTPVPAEFAGTPLTRIGTMLEGPVGRVTLGGKPLAPLGHDHFRS